jgi:putative spermidine/putrescine transport system substrate-binding protein
MLSSGRGIGRMRFWVMGCVALAVSGGLGACGGSSSSKGTTKLTIAGWGGALDEGTKKSYLAPFDAENKTTSQFADAPGTQLAGVESQNKAKQIQWDALDSVDGGTAYTLAAKNKLEPLPASLKAKFEGELGAKNVTSFGFAHGNLGNVIVCNMDKMKTCPANMAQFYDTKMFPQSREFGGIISIEAATTAEVAAGMPISQTATTPVDVKAAIKTLEGLKPKIKVFWQSGDQQVQAMKSGQVSMGIMWSNRAYELASQGAKVKIVWLDGAYEPSFWTVLKGAPQAQTAFKLLAWIADHPKNEAQWAQEIHISVPNAAALNYIPKSFSEQLADNPVNYKQLAIPNFGWYAKHGTELDTAYENFLRG